MLGFYHVTKRLYDLFTTEGFKTITLDDEQDMDLKRQSIYPLAHIIPTSSTYNSKTNSFGFILIVLDLTDFSKKEEREQDLMFYGIDNRQDILHALHQKLRNVVEQFVRGDSFSETMQIELPVGIDPFIAEFDNVLTGWSAQVNIEVPQTTNVC